MNFNNKKDREHSKIIQWNFKKKLLSGHGSKLIFKVLTKYDYSRMKCNGKKKLVPR